jgi:predicted ATP-grasp superfamily ATP-dependent carboligase/protein-tyrosine-phosphatase
MKRPTLILGFEPRIAIPIARSLHRHDVAVTVATFSEGAEKLRSRAVEDFVLLPEPSHGPDRFLSELTALIRKRRFDFLVPCGDSALFAVARFYTQLSPLVTLSCPPARAIEQVLDKSVTLAAAERCGISIPATYRVSSREGLEAVANNLSFPMICKPADKRLENSFKVEYVDSYASLKQLFDRAENRKAEVLLQEYIQGEGVGIEVLLREGNPVALFQHRRLRELPATGGVSVAAVAEGLCPELVHAALTLLRELEWKGAAMVEFKRNRATGKSVLMEVNGRYWGSLSVALHAGVDFPLYDWQLAHGEEPDVAAKYESGMRVRWLTGDLQRLHERFIERKTEFTLAGSRWRALVDFVADFQWSTRDMLLAAQDPIPALVELGRTARHLAIRDFKRLVRKAVPQRLAAQVRFYRQLDSPTRRAHLKLRALRLLGMRSGWLSHSPFRISTILFVCHGNIIRSPLAAASLKQYLSVLDRNKVHVTSAGLSAVPGRSADQRACQVARETGISLDEHRAQLLTDALMNQADLVFVMDRVLEARLLAAYPRMASKVFLLGNGKEDGNQGSDEIADPYHGDLADVRGCYRLVASRLSQLAPLIHPSAGVVIAEPGMGTRGSQSRIGHSQAVQR